MLTEEEAKQRWCPWARVGNARTGIGSINRSSLPEHKDTLPEVACCIASSCMAWRWMPHAYEIVPGVEKPAGEGWEEIPPASFNQVNRSWRRKMGGQHGYCGNAGRPT